MREVARSQQTYLLPRKAQATHVHTHMHTRTYPQTHTSSKQTDRQASPAFAASKLPFFYSIQTGAREPPHAHRRQIDGRKHGTSRSREVHKPREKWIEATLSCYQTEGGKRSVAAVKQPGRYGGGGEMHVWVEFPSDSYFQRGESQRIHESSSRVFFFQREERLPVFRGKERESLSRLAQFGLTSPPNFQDGRRRGKPVTNAQANTILYYGILLHTYIVRTSHAYVALLLTGLSSPFCCRLSVCVQYVRLQQHDLASELQSCLLALSFSPLRSARRQQSHTQKRETGVEVHFSSRSRSRGRRLSSQQKTASSHPILDGYIYMDRTVYPKLAYPAELAYKYWYCCHSILRTVYTSIYSLPTECLSGSLSFFFLSSRSYIQKWASTSPKKRRMDWLCACTYVQQGCVTYIHTYIAEKETAVFRKQLQLRTC